MNYQLVFSLKGSQMLLLKETGLTKTLLKNMCQIFALFLLIVTVNFPFLWKYKSFTGFILYIHFVTFI